MVHLLERRHNDRFHALMDGFLPQWRAYRDELNRAPLAHEDWQYWGGESSSSRCGWKSRLFSWQGVKNVLQLQLWNTGGRDKHRWNKKCAASTLATFAKPVLICALSILLQEVWINSETFFEAFDTIITNLPQSFLVGKIAETIIERGVNMIRYCRDYLALQNQIPAENKAQGKAKGLSE